MYESVYQFCCFIDVYRSFRWMKTMLYQHLVKCYDIERNIEVRLDELKLSSETVIVSLSFHAVSGARGNTSSHLTQKPD